MTTQEKVQLVLNVIDGKSHPSTLKEILGEPSDGNEVNVFKAAVDHCVGKVLRQQGAGPQFRFKVKQHGRESFTDWKPEQTQFSASMTMGQLRLEHPHAEISIERQY